MKILYSKEQIEAAVNYIANQIDKDNINTDPPVMVCVLTGGFMFFSDLVRSVNTDCIIDFVRAKSYQGKEQSELRITKTVDSCIFNKTVYLIDDILDSGVTINKLTEHLQALNPKKIIPVTLFKRENAIATGIYGIEVPEGLWIHGYGLNDSNNLKRNLLDVYVE